MASKKYRFKLHFDTNRGQNKHIVNCSDDFSKILTWVSKQWTKYVSDLEETAYSCRDEKIVTGTVIIPWSNNTNFSLESEWSGDSNCFTVKTFSCTVDGIDEEEYNKIVHTVISIDIDCFDISNEFTLW